MTSPCDKPDSLTEALGKAKDELSSLMQGGLDAIGDVSSKIGEMGNALNSELSNAVTEVNDFQTKLNEALSKSGSEFAKAMNELNDEFGQAMAEAGEDINEVLGKIGVELDKIPTLDELANLTLEELAKLAPPSTDTAKICEVVPKVQLSPDGKAVKAPEQPLLPKLGPAMATFKAPKTSAESNPSRKAVSVYVGGSKTVFDEIKKGYIEEVYVKSKKGNFGTYKKVLSPENKQKLKAETYYYYESLAEILGVEINEVHMASKAVVITKKEADDTGVSKTNYLDRVKKRYEFDINFWGLELSFEEVVKAWQEQYTKPVNAQAV